MNDRYLFRAKRIDNGEWAKGSLFAEGEITEIIRGTCNTIGIEGVDVNPETICQCTGLKDKNGNLIWENDVVDGHVKRGAAFYHCKVLWNECKARFDVRAVECNFPMTLDECTDDISICGLDYEVIGNIFDNPELINE